jgi:hypothetical protein
MLMLSRDAGKEIEIDGAEYQKFVEMEKAIANYK